MHEVTHSRAGTQIPKLLHALNYCHPPTPASLHPAPASQPERDSAENRNVHLVALRVLGTTTQKTTDVPMATLLGGAVLSEEEHLKYLRPGNPPHQAG